MIFEKIRERLQEKKNRVYQNFEYLLDEGKEKLEMLSEVEVQTYFDAIDIINQVEAEYNNGWISVESELPEPYKKVLVLEENGEIHLCRYHNESTRFYYDGSDWDIKLGCVTHWRELPQPPKGE